MVVPSAMASAEAMLQANTPITLENNSTRIAHEQGCKTPWQTNRHPITTPASTTLQCFLGGEMTMAATPHTPSSVMGDRAITALTITGARLYTRASTVYPLHNYAKYLVY
ncbi:MAG: hypothetical protein ACR5K7_05805 [Symbiopectobacterium sp.]